MDSQATVYLALDPKITKDKPRTIKVSVTYNRKTIAYSLGAKNKHIASSIDDIKRTKLYKDELREIDEKFAIAKAIVKNLDRNFSFEDFSKEYKSQAFGKNDSYGSRKKLDLGSLYEDYYNASNVSDKTKLEYNIGLNWIRKYRPSAKITDIDTDFLNKVKEFIRKENKKIQIERYRKKFGCEPPMVKEIEDVSISAYYRGLRAVCNFALEEGYIKQWSNPFGRSRKQIKLTSKVKSNRALKDEALTKFIKYKPEGNKKELKEFAWSMFMFSFLSGGMNSADIYALKNSSIDQNEIRYIRQKTQNTQKVQEEVDFALPNLAITILKKYGHVNPHKPQDYIFPFYTADMTEKSKMYKRQGINKQINKGLNIICDELGLSRYTLSQARHSQATYLSDMGVEIIDIAQKMAHTSSKTTEDHYIKSSNTKKQSIMKVLENLVGDISQT